MSYPVPVTGLVNSISVIPGPLKSDNGRDFCLACVQWNSDYCGMISAISVS